LSRLDADAFLQLAKHCSTFPPLILMQQLRSLWFFIAMFYDFFILGQIYVDPDLRACFCISMLLAGFPV
jgi:hypothetical protein